MKLFGFPLLFIFQGNLLSIFVFSFSLHFPFFLFFFLFFIAFAPLISQFLPLSQVSSFSVPFSFLGLFISSFPLCLMDYYSNIRHTSPSIAFFFSHLGAFLGSPSGHCPQVGGFVLGDNGLELALVSLYPLLRQSLDWFSSMREV